MQQNQQEMMIETPAQRALFYIRKEMAELDGQVVALQQKLNRASADSSALAEARAELSAAKSKKRGLLARIWLGESKDSTDAVNQEIREAEQKAESCSESAQGAEVASEIIGAQINELRQKARSLAEEIPALRYAIGVERLSDLCADYYATVDAAEKAFAKVRGAALAINRIADPYSGRVYVTSDIAPTVMDFPRATTLESCNQFMTRRNAFDLVMVEREDFGQYLANI